MADDTLISWADKTHNHWIGCMKVGPGCDGCYAEHLMDTRLGRVAWGAPGAGAGTRSLTSEANRKKPLTWNRQAAKSGERPFVFCSSLADVFDKAALPTWRSDLFALIKATPHLTWLLLTKRPQNIVSMVERDGCVADNGMPYLPRNAAIGCTVVNQEEAERDVPVLLEAKRLLGPAFAFLSMEPLLGPVNLRRLSEPGPLAWQLDALRGVYQDGPAERQAPAKIDWVITGGETDQGAHKARPANPQWFRDIRDQCLAAGVSYHHKQNGEWVSVSEVEGHGPHFSFADGRTVRRVGKDRAGRTIDGLVYDARPIVRAA